MLTMAQIHSIRQRYFTKGESISQIAKITGNDRKTIRAYINKDDWNLPKPKVVRALCPKLEPFKQTIDEWLTKDKQAKSKQRHTARRVYDRLCQEEVTFCCSYRTVATYVKIRKKEIFGSQSSGYLPLEHPPGEAQVDFGAAQFYERGVLRNGKYLEVTFPYSNQGYLQLFPGENQECLFEGLVQIFQYLGGIPPKLWFDNTSTIVTKVMKGGKRDLTEGFLRFQNHYQFQSVFCNANAGNEKGCVENKVGYHRRNLLVPIPQCESLAEYNVSLLERCTEDGRREHYRHNTTIETLFQGDCQVLLPLPSIALDLASYKHIKANGYGRVLLHGGKHEYSAAPKYAGESLIAKMTSDAVVLLDRQHREIVRHKRLYGDQKQQSMDWLPYLKQLSIRPRALKYSGIYEMMPTALKTYLENCDPEATGHLLRTVAELTDHSSFDCVMGAVEQALQCGTMETDSLRSLHRRIHTDVPNLPDMELPPGLPLLQPGRPNLAAYDVALLREVQDVESGNFGLL